MANKTINIRMPEETLAQLKDCHAKTYEAHRLSFNQWLLARIQLSFTVEGT